MHLDDIDRRTFLTAAGATGAVLLAGCTGGSDGDGAGNGNGGGGDGNGGGGGGGGDGGDGGGGDSGGTEPSYLDEEPEYSDWFQGANAYDRTVDHRGESEVTVLVGGDGGLAFEPAAVAVSTGTTVTWEWTGEGGSHNVVSRDDEFQSEYADSEGHTITHTFEEAGTYEYYCDPHEAAGMKGVVEVR